VRINLIDIVSTRLDLPIWHGYIRALSSLLATIKFFPISLSIGLEADGLAESASARAKNLTPALLAGESFEGIRSVGGLMSGRIISSDPEAQ
jgi:hypothetical protein